MTPEQARAECQASIAALAASTWALARRYQTQVDAWLQAGQPVPPPPRELEGKVTVIDGRVEITG
jgi:hypothetical protein